MDSINHENVELKNWTISSAIGSTNEIKTQIMFQNCYRFNGDVSGWTITNPTSLHKTFNECHYFRGKGLSTWQIISNNDSQPFRMDYMFFSCYHLGLNTNIDISSDYWQANPFGSNPNSLGTFGTFSDANGSIYAINHWAYDPSDNTIIICHINTSQATHTRFCKITVTGIYDDNSSKYKNGGTPPTFNNETEIINYYAGSSTHGNNHTFTKGASFPRETKMCKIDLDGSYIYNSCRIGDRVDITNESELKDVYDNATNASNDFTFETGVNYSFLPENSEEAKIEMYVDNHLMKTFTPKNKTGIWYLGGLLNRRQDNDGPAVYISSPELPTYGKVGEFS